ncbi:MAG: hypothetical protein HYV40_00660 [Candidatus Levybacteria bacterium]|nr:hypothetical protein [Candidatus Levybacteria bacterium]
MKESSKRSWQRVLRTNGLFSLRRLIGDFVQGAEAQNKNLQRADRFRLFAEDFYAILDAPAVFGLTDEEIGRHRELFTERLAMAINTPRVEAALTSGTPRSNEEVGMFAELVSPAVLRLPLVPDTLEKEYEHIFARSADVTSQFVVGYYSKRGKYDEFVAGMLRFVEDPLLERKGEAYPFFVTPNVLADTFQQSEGMRVFASLIRIQRPGELSPTS